jgi:hypothetical protein
VAHPHPLVYEVNTWAWLAGLSRPAGHHVHLGTVPPEEWDRIAALGFDTVWLMGVWERSPAGVAIALSDDTLMASFRAALPDLTEADVVGSPYCIRRYVVDDHLGGPDGLAAARAALAERGLRLLLDFVPNHVAPDHPWALEQPELFVRGDDGDLARDPASFVRVGDHVLARGRDPFFPAWPDVVQLNAFDPGLRAAATWTLGDLGRQCDGVRCDMAMLMLEDVFERTWGERAGRRPERDYWAEVIPAVRRSHPGFTFVAEAYWDREWDLMQQGFDYCYDKRLYDRLAHEDADSVRRHLGGDLDYQRRLLRFVENHDEPRAAATFPPARQRAATVTTLTQAGMRLVHQGQETGAKVRLPVFLGRFPDEPVDEDLARFHRSLLDALDDPTFRDGEWRLARVSGWDGNQTARNLVAWAWTGESRWLVVVNLSAASSSGHVATGWDDLRGQTLRLVDPMAWTTFERTGDDLAGGLYVSLDPWQWHLLRVDGIE